MEGSREPLDTQGRPPGQRPGQAGQLLLLNWKLGRKASLHRAGPRPQAQAVFILRQDPPRGPAGGKVASVPDSQEALSGEPHVGAEAGGAAQARPASGEEPGRLPKVQEGLQALGGRGKLVAGRGQQICSK